MPKPATTPSPEIRDVVEGDTLTLTTPTYDAGTRKYRRVTLDLPKTADDMPRRLRRQVRSLNQQYNLGRPIGEPLDVYGLTLAIGHAFARHHNVHVDLDDPAMTEREAETQEAVIALAGIRVLNAFNTKDAPEDEAEGGEGNAEAAEATE